MYNIIIIKNYFIIADPNEIVQEQHPKPNKGRYYTYAILL